MPAPKNSSRHLSVLKSAARKVAAAGAGAEFSFYMLKDAEGKFLLHIDPMPGKSLKRFRTPKLIDQHLKNTRYEKKGLDAATTFVGFRSCAGTVTHQDEKIVFNVRSRAGKASPRDLRSGLKTVFHKYLSKPWTIQTTRDNEEGPVVSTEETEAQESSAIIAELFGRKGLRGSRPRVVDMSGDIDRLGENIGKLEDYLAASAKTLSAKEERKLNGLLETMQAHYETVQSWDVRGGLKAVANNFRALDPAVVEEAAVAFESELEELDSLSGVERVKKVSGMLEMLADVDFTQQQLSDYMQQLEQTLGDDETASQMLMLFKESESLANGIDTNFAVSDELIDESDRLAQQGLKQLERLLKKKRRGEVLTDKHLDNWGPHIKVLTQSFAGGKQAALFAGRMGKYAKAITSSDETVRAAAAAEFSTSIALYGQHQQQGESLLEGISYMAKSGFLSETSLTLTADAQAKLGPLTAKAQGLIDLYAKVSGNVTATLALSASDGIKADFTADFEAAGVIRAEGWTSVEIAGVGKAHAKGFARAVVGAEGNAAGSFVLSPKGVLTLAGQVSVTAGLSVETGGEFTLSTPSGSELFKTAGKVKAVAGFHAELGGRFTFDAGKIKLKLNVGAALGIGGGVDLELELNLREVAEFIVDVVVDYLKDIYRAHPLAYRILNGETSEKAGKFEALLESDTDFETLAVARGYSRVTAFGIDDARMLYTKILSSDIPKIEKWFDDEAEARDKVAKILKEATKELRSKKMKLGGKTLPKRRLSGIFDIDDPNSNEAIEAANEWQRVVQSAVIDTSWWISSVMITVNNDPKNPYSINNIQLHER